MNEMIVIFGLGLISWLIAEFIAFLRKKKAVKISGIENSEDITHLIPTPGVKHSHPYRFIDTEESIFVYEKIDWKWVKTGVYEKKTVSIRFIDPTIDTLFLLSCVYWYFRRNINYQPHK